jgi:arylsulfatase A-like enzyme
VLFRNAYANPVCTPTRAVTLTGRYGFRTGIGSLRGDLSTSELILPELVAATHANAALGKWHLGPNDDPDHPNDTTIEHYAAAVEAMDTELALLLLASRQRRLRN